MEYTTHTIWREGIILTRHNLEVGGYTDENASMSLGGNITRRLKLGELQRTIPLTRQCDNICDAVPNGELVWISRR